MQFDAHNPARIIAGRLVREFTEAGTPVATTDCVCERDGFANRSPW